MKVKIFANFAIGEKFNGQVSAPE